MWTECPAKAAYRRPDIDSALTVRGLAATSPLADWPRGYASRVFEILSMIDHESHALREAVAQ